MACNPELPRPDKAFPSRTQSESDVPAPSEEEIDEALRVFNDPKTVWHDANDVLYNILQGLFGDERSTLLSPPDETDQS